MYNVYNKSEIFYMYSFDKDETVLIGDKQDLLLFLSKGFRLKPSFILFEQNYKRKDTLNNYNNEYFDNINMGNDTYCVKTFFNMDFYSIEYIPQKYLFSDGYGRIIDVRDFRQEAFSVYLEELNKPFRFNFRRYYGFNRTRSHSKYSWKNKFPGNRNCVRRLDSMFKRDPDFKDYNFKRIEDANNPYPDWWDDASRRVEGNWKSQYKVKRQYNIHNGKDNKSIRYFNEDEYDMDELLYEDFIAQFDE